MGIKMRQIDRLQRKTEWMNEEVKKDVFDWRLVENFWFFGHHHRHMLTEKLHSYNLCCVL